MNNCKTNVDKSTSVTTMNSISQLHSTGQVSLLK
jgi:hypothetical protein